MMKKFGERLKELRTEKGYSIQKLSKVLHVSPASIHRWENNQADIQGSYIIMLAQFFDVTTDYLLGLED